MYWNGRIGSYSEFASHVGEHCRGDQHQRCVHTSLELVFSSTGVRRETLLILDFTFSVCAR